MKASTAAGTKPAGYPWTQTAPMTLSDLWEQLVWPRLLEAPRLALRPARLGFAFVFLIGVAAIVGVADRLDGSEASVLRAYLSGDVPRQLEVAQRGVMQGESGQAARAVYRMFVSGPGKLISDSPWMVVLTLPVLLVWTALMGGAISRTAACDFAHGLRITWPQGLGFAAGRWPSLFGSLSIPLLLIWIKCAALAVGAWALLGLPVLDVLGGLGWGLFLLGGLVVTVLVLAFALGHAMLVPAVTCDAADAIDSIQHAYAYVFARPLRLVLYLVILLVQASLVAMIGSLVIALVGGVTAGTTGVWLGERGGEILANRAGLEGSSRGAAWLINFWTAIPALLLSAYLVSLYWCSGTLLFLAMRRICDGQEPTEIWMPGMVEGTLAGDVQAKAV